VWQLFNITLLMAIPNLSAGRGLIIFAVLRYRRKHADEMPEQCTATPRSKSPGRCWAFANITVLFVLTRARSTPTTARKPSGNHPARLIDQRHRLHVQLDYEYFIRRERGNRVRTTKRVTVPADRNVLLRISSRDVQHKLLGA